MPLICHVAGCQVTFEFISAGRMKLHSEIAMQVGRRGLGNPIVGLTLQDDDCLLGVSWVAIMGRAMSGAHALSGAGWGDRGGAILCWC